MSVELNSYKKSVSEKYLLRLNNGLDYQIFNIDETGAFSSQGSYGNYSYHWTSFGESFKKFLIGLDQGYLFRKLCTPTYFDFYNYIECCKLEIISQRKNYELDKEQARKLYNYITSELEETNSLDYTIMQFYNSNVFDEVYNGICITETEFCPEYDYSPNEKTFIKEIYPAFKKILKNEKN